MIGFSGRPVANDEIFSAFTSVTAGVADVDLNLKPFGTACRNIAGNADLANDPVTTFSNTRLILF